MRRPSPSLKDLKISRISCEFRISTALTKVSYVSFSLEVTKRAKISAIVGVVKYS